jgi:hypothetical protein
MDASSRVATFEGEIESYVRAECIGFQRGTDGLVPVLQLLVQPKRGPLTTVYVVQTRDESERPLYRFRPPIDIPAPQRAPLWND